MMKNFSKLDMSKEFTPSRALLQKIKQIQEQPDELFSSDDFIIRLRQDYQIMLDEAAGLSTIEYCKLMQHSKIRFVHDFMEAYQTAFEDIVSLYRTRIDDTDFLMEIENICDRQLESYAVMDIGNWWGRLMKNQASWPLFAERLYETKNIAGINPQRLIDIITYILLLNSILRGDAEKLGLTLDDNAFREQKEGLNKDEEGVLTFKPSTNTKGSNAFVSDEKKVLDKELFARAVENCQQYFWGNASYAVVFCIYRDDYEPDITQTGFEEMVERLSYKKKRDYCCPAGTIANAFRHNPIFKTHISRWASQGASSRILKLINMFRKELEC